MRNLFNKATSTAIAVAAAALLSAGSANAQAVEIGLNFCVFLDAGCDEFSCDIVNEAPVGNVHFQLVADHPELRIRAVLTGSGNVEYSCKGVLPVDPGVTTPDRGAHVISGDVLGFPCFINGDATTPPFITSNWHQVITKHGKVSITCHFNAQTE